jgi:hypothetical protein
MLEHSLGRQVLGPSLGEPVGAPAGRQRLAVMGCTSGVGQLQHFRLPRIRARFHGPGSSRCAGGGGRVRDGLSGWQGKCGGQQTGGEGVRRMDSSEGGRGFGGAGCQPMTAARMLAVSWSPTRGRIAVLVAYRGAGGWAAPSPLRVLTLDANGAGMAALAPDGSCVRRLGTRPHVVARRPDGRRVLPTRGRAPHARRRRDIGTRQVRPWVRLAGLAAALTSDRRLMPLGRSGAACPAPGRLSP